MKKLFLTVIISWLIFNLSNVANANNKHNDLLWQSISKLNTPEEKASIQAGLNDWGCKGVPLKNRTLTPDPVLSEQYMLLLSQICIGAKFARIQNKGTDRLIVVQFGSTGSCGDFDTEFFIEDENGQHIRQATTGRLKSVCGENTYEATQTDDGDILIVESGVEEYKQGHDWRGDLKLLWNGTELKQLSSPLLGYSR